MTDAAIATIMGAFLLFGGQVVTMIQNVFISRKSDEIHTLADGNLRSIKEELAAATEKVASLDKLVALLADRKGDAGEPGKQGEVGETGKTGKTGETGRSGTAIKVIE